MNIVEKTADQSNNTKRTQITLSQQLYVKKHRRHHHIVTLLRFIILILFLGVWEFAGKTGLIDTFFFQQSQYDSFLFYKYAA